MTPPLGGYPQAAVVFCVNQVWVLYSVCSNKIIIDFYFNVFAFAFVKTGFHVEDSFIPKANAFTELALRVCGRKAKVKRGNQIVEPITCVRSNFIDRHFWLKKARMY
jgi:hypothetical protein